MEAGGGVKAASFFLAHCWSSHCRGWRLWEAHLRAGLGRKTKGEMRRGDRGFLAYPPDFFFYSDQGSSRGVTFRFYYYYYFFFAVGLGVTRASDPPPPFLCDPKVSCCFYFYDYESAAEW